MHELIQRIKRIEDEVATTVRNSHSRELMTVDAALDQILLGFNDIVSRRNRLDDRLESARLFLVTRSFNSLWVARNTLEGGYYQQALALVRMAMEDNLIVYDIEKHSPTLTGLLGGDAKLGKGDLAFGKMAERLSPKAKETWDFHYGFLSERAAHPRPESMQGLVAIEPDGMTSLRPGSHYDSADTKLVLYFLARELIQVLKTLVAVIHRVEDTWSVDTSAVFQKESDWLVGAKSVFDELMLLVNKSDQWASDQLRESAERP